MCRFECSYSSKGPYTPVRRLTRGPGVLNVSMLSPTLCFCFLYLRSKFLLLLLHNSGRNTGDDSLSPPALQEAFPAPDVLEHTLTHPLLCISLFFSGELSLPPPQPGMEGRGRFTRVPGSPRGFFRPGCVGGLGYRGHGATVSACLKEQKNDGFDGFAEARRQQRPRRSEIARRGKLEIRFFFFCTRRWILSYPVGFSFVD